MYLVKVTILRKFQVHIFKQASFGYEKLAPCIYLRVGFVTLSYLYRGTFSSYFSIDRGKKVHLTS